MATTLSGACSIAPCDNLTSMLQPGTNAPEFTLPDQDGQRMSLADEHGHWVILWWYPKASTRG